MSCHACERIEQIRQNANPHFIAELSESYVVLADEQAYRGWCVLLIKGHHEHLTEIPLERQLRLWQDVAKVADAMTRQLKPKRINYECLGNLLHHIHWHIIPRYEGDPEPTMPVWVRPAEERKVILNDINRDKLIRSIRTAIVNVREL